MVFHIEITACRNDVRQEGAEKDICTLERNRKIKLQALRNECFMIFAAYQVLFG